MFYNEINAEIVEECVMAILFLPKLSHLPIALPIEGAVRIELEEGVPIFRASRLVCDRIEALSR